MPGKACLFNPALRAPLKAAAQSGPRHARHARR
jgi:hypothetical protein